MANLAYLSLWLGEFSIERGLEQLEALLERLPVSAARPGYRLVVRSLATSESPTLERDLIDTPGSVRELAAEFLHNDTAYEVTAHWELWQPQAEDWESGPAALEILLQGEEFDEGRCRETGHLWLTLGPESLFLPAEGRAGDASLPCVRENARRLLGLLAAFEKTLPGAERRLWSEGEPEFAMRVEQLAGKKS